MAACCALVQVISGGVPLCPRKRECVQCNNTPRKIRADVHPRHQALGCRAVFSAALVVVGLILLGVALSPVNRDEEGEIISFGYFTAGGVLAGMFLLMYIMQRTQISRMSVPNPDYKPGPCQCIGPGNQRQEQVSPSLRPNRPRPAVQIIQPSQPSPHIAPSTGQGTTPTAPAMSSDSQWGVTGGGPTQWAWSQPMGMGGQPPTGPQPPAYDAPPASSLYQAPPPAGPPPPSYSDAIAHKY